MGLACSKDYEGKLICVKCGDKFYPKYGAKSERTSCRCHKYVNVKNKKICIDCRIYFDEKRLSNCYHSYN